MAIYSLAQRTIVVAADAATWEVRTAASDAPRVVEISFSQVTAVAATIGLGRPAAIGDTPTSPVTFLAEDSADPAATVTACVAWGTPPTVPTAFFRRITCVAAIGAGVIWTFPRGLKIPISNSIVLWVIATAPVLDAWAVIDE